MVSLDNFDAVKAEEESGFKPIPAGLYLAAIIDSKNKQTINGDGSFLALTFEVLDGKHKGRRLWTNLNLDNPSDIAVRIASGDLAKICKAVGVMTPGDSRELHDIPLTILVVCEKRKDTGEMGNQIKGYLKKGERLDSAEATAITNPVYLFTSDDPPWKQNATSNIKEEIDNGDDAKT